MKNNVLRILVLLFTSAFIIVNFIAYFHAYKFTHFNDSSKKKTQDAALLSTTEKISTLFLGVSNPRPFNKRLPELPYEKVYFKASDLTLEGWYLPVPNATGTVVLFHGFSSEKSSMLDRAYVLNDHGYNTLLVDHRGSGGSQGEVTTIGFQEAEDVKAAHDFIRSKGEEQIFLMGSSMGAVAIMRAMHLYRLPVVGVVLECPFATMMETVEARFRRLHVPVFPMAYLLMFWGGLQNGFNAFTHDPVNYALDMHCPVLLLYGEKDEKVSRSETERIFVNLPVNKKLITYPLSGHESYLTRYKEEWGNDVIGFMRNIVE